MLYLVPTPLGNLGDISDRAKAILAQVDLVACEDTRVTGRLLNHLNISKPLVSYRDENELQQAEALLQKLQAGQRIALVCDAGTPAISDPGFRLVRACRKAGLPVTPIPGPCAAITALSASGLPSDQFLFTGFLPPKSSGRRSFFEKYQAFPGTLIAYESCHRIEKAVNEALDVLGPTRVVAIARELTKHYESFYVGALLDVQKCLLQSPIKGEYVFIIAAASFSL